MVANLVDSSGVKLEAGGAFAVAVAGIREGIELVGGHEAVDAVAEVFGHEGGVVGKCIGGITGLPAAGKALGQVPVEKGHEGLNAVGEEFVHNAVVVVEAFGVERGAASGEDARPADGEAVTLDAEGLEQADVFLPEVVGVTGDVAGVPVVDLAGGVGEGVPDGGAAAVVLCAALHLVGGGGASP